MVRCRQLRSSFAKLDSLKETRNPVFVNIGVNIDTNSEVLEAR